jgi:hypothetical protein
MSHIRNHGSAWRGRPGNWVLIGFLAVAAFFLRSEHRAHALGVLPYLIWYR